MSSKKKGKATKQPKKESPASTANIEQEEENQESAEERFEQELNWCIEQIVLGFEHQNPNSKQAYEAVKILKILRSDKAPMIKKRQAMRNAFGDYRQKMKAEERKTVAKLKKVSFTPVKDKQGENSCYYKKSLNKQGKCSTTVKDIIGNSEIETEDSTSETKTLTSSSNDISQNDVSNETGSGFKFNRSNNAFTFNFDNQQHKDSDNQQHKDSDNQQHKDSDNQQHKDSDNQQHKDSDNQQHTDSDKTDSTGLDNFVNGLKLSNCVTDQKQKSENDTEMTNKTSQKDFKMVKTDNSFRFNFSVQNS